MAEAALGRRGPAVAEAVLDAVLVELDAHGYALQVEEVAARAGVHKTTVYRRWPSKAELVAAALARLAGAAVPDPSPAQLDEPIDALVGLAVSVAAALRDPAGTNALRAVAAATGDDPALASQVRGLLDQRYALAVRLVEVAQGRGELRADVAPVQVWEAMVNPLHLRAILGRPADEATAAAGARLVLDGARARG